jgi:hypothetical protein
MSQSDKKGTLRRKNRRLHKLLNKASGDVIPMKAHGFAAHSIAEALVLPLLLDNETGYLGLWTRLGDHFQSEWDKGPKTAEIHLAQDFRGHWVLERAADAPFLKALAQHSYNKAIQKRKISLDIADKIAATIEQKLLEGPQPLTTLREEARPFDVVDVADRRGEQGSDSAFEVVLDALFKGKRLVKVPRDNAWDFHLWSIALTPPALPLDEAVLQMAQRYCEAYPFAQLEDFAWWTQLQKAKVKDGFIKAKTAWRQAHQNKNDEDEDENAYFGLFFTPYRDPVTEGNRYYEKAWGLNVDPHPRAPGGLPLVILDGQVLGHWSTVNGLVAIADDVDAACMEEESALFRFKEDMKDALVYRFTDLLPVYDIYQ